MKSDRLPTDAERTYFKTVREVFTENTSGLEPIGTKVLILTDSIGDTTKTGALQLPADLVERMTLAITSGVIAGVGGCAWTDWPNSSAPWPGRVPQVGDRVHIAKYAGSVMEGKDGKQYKFVQDTDVMGFETGELKPQVFGLPKVN